MMASYADKVTAAIAEADAKAWQKQRAILYEGYDYFGEAQFEPVTEQQLDEFMSGKQVMKVEPIDAPNTDGFSIFLGCGGPALWVAEIDYEEPDADAIALLHARVAKLT